MKHISIRVPWHDNKWNGAICPFPELNSFCRILPNIAERKDDIKEKSLANKLWKDIEESDIPACKSENGGFMSDHPFTRIFRHPYSNYEGNPHQALLPTKVTVDPYSFFAVPFRYMLKDNQGILDSKYPGFHADEVAPFKKKQNWVYGRERQDDILNWFFRDVKEEQSLVVFYCKNGNPIDDEGLRMIIGIGEISKVNGIGYYDSKENFTYPYWDRLLSHTIRQDLDKSRGFLLPYHEYLALDEEYVKEKTGKTKEQVLDEIKLSFEKLGESTKILNELSYGCEHVCNHSMLVILGEARKSIEKIIEHGLIGGNWKKQVRWIDEQISKVKKESGPFPGFSEALRALGIDYAYLIEHDLRENGYCEAKGNPWIAFGKLMNGKIQLPKMSYSDELPTYHKIWESVSTQEKEVIELLSRFEISEDSMSKWIETPSSYENLLKNPYLISEEDNEISTQMIDIGVMKDVEIQGSFTPKAPSLVETELDERRIRSIVIEKLKAALLDGDTLLSTGELADYVKDILAKEDLRFPQNYFLANREFMEEKLRFIQNKSNSLAIQLHEYANYEDFLAKVFKGRASKSIRYSFKEDWGKIVRSSIDDYDENNERSRSGIEDQQRALEILANKRLSVLTGPAGSGKTSVVKAFLSSDTIRKQGVLLLAPTGKARVRLGEMGQGIRALTVAQFLTRHGCFDWDSMIPVVPKDVKKYSDVQNVIIDECSMLTVDYFNALFRCLDLTKIERIILIGDPYQLPPIGAGRPFADLCSFLMSKDGESYGALAELKTVVRTITIGDSDALTLASWFSGEKPSKDADEVLDKIVNNKLDNDLSVYDWENESDLKDKLHNVIISELSNGDEDIKDKLMTSIGLGGSWDDVVSNPNVLENFQILSPVKNPVWGTLQINNYVQEWINDNENKSLGYYINMGNQSLCSGDKVIQLVNEVMETYPEKEKYQLSNGQIGFVRFARKKGYRNKRGYIQLPNNYADVAFAGIKGKMFPFKGDSSEDIDHQLELAFAITIHKSQGSDFNTVLVVIPKECRLLSRELIYTALTRAKKKLILFVQEGIQWLMSYSKPQYSIVARRNTNLFEYSVREEKNLIPYSENLIHQTLKDGLVVRSKSEVIIANMLIENNINFEYEKMLERGGRKTLPDFTFEDYGGDPIIWEHLGMLENPSYRHAWEKKLEFYKSIGFKEGENLFTTRDHEGKIDSKEIKAVVDKIHELVL